jgi:hypothetical protein
MYTAHDISFQSLETAASRGFDVERPSSAPGHSSQILQKFDSNVITMFAIRNFEHNAKGQNGHAF